MNSGVGALVEGASLPQNPQGCSQSETPQQPTEQTQNAVDTSRSHSSSQVSRRSHPMLRLVTVRRVLKNPRITCQELLSFRQNLAGKLYQTRSLSFLPIVSSLDTTKEEPPQKSELEKPRVIHTPDDRCVTSSESPEPHDNATIENRHDIDDEKFYGESPAQSEYFSASLADGSIVHTLYRNTTLSQFGRLASETSKFWKQHSHLVRNQISAQNFGLAVWPGPDSEPIVSAKIYDIDASRGPRAVYGYRWNVSNLSIIESKRLSGRWTSVGNVLSRALENHVGSVDQHDSLVLLSPPAPHPLFHAFKEIKRIFAHDRPTKSNPISVVLGERSLVSPIPGFSIESDTFLSLTKLVWQWLQHERGLRGEALSPMTHVRIMYVY